MSPDPRVPCSSDRVKIKGCPAPRCLSGVSFTDIKLKERSTPVPPSPPPSSYSHTRQSPPHNPAAASPRAPHRPPPARRPTPRPGGGALAVPGCVERQEPVSATPRALSRGARVQRRRSGAGSGAGAAGGRGSCGAGAAAAVTFGVGADEDADAPAARHQVGRQRREVAGERRPPQRRVPRAGQPAARPGRPHPAGRAAGSEQPPERRGGAGSSRHRLKGSGHRDPRAARGRRPPPRRRCGRGCWPPPGAGARGERGDDAPTAPRAAPLRRPAARRTRAEKFAAERWRARRRLRRDGGPAAAAGPPAPPGRPRPPPRAAGAAPGGRSGRRVALVPPLPARVCNVQSGDASGEADGAFAPLSVSQLRDRIFIGKLLPAHPLGSEEFRARFVFRNLLHRSPTCSDAKERCSCCFFSFLCF